MNLSCNNPMPVCNPTIRRTAKKYLLTPAQIMKNYPFVIAVLATMLSCGNSDIYYNGDFDEVAAAADKSGKPFCIVLVDNMQYVSREYAYILQVNHERVAGRAVFDIVDIEKEENGWYVKWLNPVSVPLTCVFSEAGDLVDLIPGMSDESFSYIEESVEHSTTTRCYWPNRFNLDKARSVPLLGQVLRNRKFISNGIFIAGEAVAMTDSLKYPYSLGLKLSGQLMIGDTLSAMATAGELLEQESPHNLKIYRSEFIMARKIENPDFNIADEPNIRVGEQIVTPGSSTTGGFVTIELPVYNDGNKPLNITKITANCSCLRNLYGGGTIVVAPRDSTVLTFALSPRGGIDVGHEVLLVSNGINNPLLNIGIRADFGPDADRNADSGF